MYDHGVVYLGVWSWGGIGPGGGGGTAGVQSRHGVPRLYGHGGWGGGMIQGWCTAGV